MPKITGVYRSTYNTVNLTRQAKKDDRTAEIDAVSGQNKLFTLRKYCQNNERMEIYIMFLNGLNEKSLYLIKGPDDRNNYRIKFDLLLH